MSSRQERLQFVSSNTEAMFAVKDQYERRKATRFYGQQKPGDFRVTEVIISLCIRTTWSHLISVKKICEESIEGTRLKCEFPHVYVLNIFCFSNGPLDSLYAVRIFTLLDMLKKNDRFSVRFYISDSFPTSHEL